MIISSKDYSLDVKNYGFIVYPTIDKNSICVDFNLYVTTKDYKEYYSHIRHNTDISTNDNEAIDQAKNIALQDIMNQMKNKKKNISNKSKSTEITNKNNNTSKKDSSKTKTTRKKKD